MYEIFSQYFPLWIFILIMVGTPGPANFLLLSSGAQNGFIKTIPFISGLVSGKLFLKILMSLSKIVNGLLLGTILQILIYY